MRKNSLLPILLLCLISSLALAATKADDVKLTGKLEKVGSADKPTYRIKSKGKNYVFTKKMLTGIDLSHLLDKEVDFKGVGRQDKKYFFIFRLDRLQQTGAGTKESPIETLVSGKLKKLKDGSFRVYLHPEKTWYVLPAGGDYAKLVDKRVRLTASVYKSKTVYRTISVHSLQAL